MRNRFVIGIIAFSFLGLGLGSYVRGLDRSGEAVEFAEYLSAQQMQNIWGGSTCDDICPTEGAYECKICLCYLGMGNFIECAVRKTFDECQAAQDGSGCVDAYHTLMAYGSTYEEGVIALGRRCADKPYCSQVNWRGINFLNANVCNCTYSGCN